LKFDVAVPGFAIEAIGAPIDLLGFGEPDEWPAPALSSEKSAAALTGSAADTPKATASAPINKQDVPAKQKSPAPASKQEAPAQRQNGSAAVAKQEAKPKGDASATEVKDFIASKTFVGAKPGMVFKKGKQGMGYYKDTYVAPPAGVKRKAEAPAAAVAPASKKISLPSGLKYEVMKPGSGAKASRGKSVQVRYDGRLAANGKRFDKGTIRFKLGAGEVIKGWDLGVEGMAVVEKSLLLIPSGLAYGKSGAPPAIPPNATLTFEVELLRV
jgi:FK506-binding nuclear protein